MRKDNTDKGANRRIREGGAKGRMELEDLRRRVPEPEDDGLVLDSAKPDKESNGEPDDLEQSGEEEEPSQNNCSEKDNEDENNKDKQ